MMRMHRSSRAPVLSATRSRVSTWTTARPLPRLLEDLDEAPALLPRQRPALGDPHEVAHAGLVALVVDVQLGGVAHGLPVDRVGPGHVDPHGDGLLASV